MTATFTAGIAAGISRRRFAAFIGFGALCVDRKAHALPIALAREAAADIDPAGFLVSEKYDGVRAIWDGRGALAFRSGLPIAAPRWFVERLPAEPLDGELWLGRGRFEPLAAAVRRQVPLDAQWRALRYMVFELPNGEGDFAQRARRITTLVAASGHPQLQAVEQQRIASHAALQRRLDEVVAGGGEGLVLHRADAAPIAGRTDALLKLKPVHDAEATVIGHVPGAGKHAGRMGALMVRADDGSSFAIGTGFSDAQRAAPPAVGTRITYRMRGTTRHGAPRFASFLRVRDANF